MTQGGYIPGTSCMVTIKRLADCTNGHRLYSIGGGLPEHMAKPGQPDAWEQLNCTAGPAE